MVVVIVAGFVLLRGTSSGPAVGDVNTLPPAMRAAYGGGATRQTNQPSGQQQQPGQ